VYLPIKLKKWLRTFLSNILYIFGILHFWAKINLRNKAVVLMYHRVLSKEDLSLSMYQAGMTVTVHTFKKQMEYIRRHFKPISPEEFVGHLQRNVPFESKTVLVTFDDGWKDNFINAYPILKENKISALIFLTTDFIGSNRRFWQQDLSDLLLAIRHKAQYNNRWWQSSADAFQDETVRWVVTSEEKDLHSALENYLNTQKKKPITQIEDLIKSLREVFLVGEELSDVTDVFMTWDEAQTMARDGIVFGPHGKSHNLLTVINSQESEKEITESKEMIEKELGNVAYAFSYPNGNYNDAVLGIVKKHGYLVAFGTEKGFVSVSDSPYTIKRVNIHEDMTKTVPMFLARIAGIA
jgi:peptidoglycan/xylan/chitin deacetylase (PgdA/CDA1 family)